MFKKLSFIFLLIVSLLGLAIGGKYVYDKQVNQLSFSNFRVSPEANNLYIPNAKLFYELNIDNELFSFPSEVLLSKTKVLSFLEKNNVTDELYFSYLDQDYTLSIKQESFESDKFIVFLENQLNIDVDKKAQTILIGNQTFYYSTTDNFFIFSNLEIQNIPTSQFEKPNGNYHYFFQKNGESNLHFFKHDNETIYSFYSVISDTIKGDPISPLGYYNNIPSNFDTLRFYGSTRLLDDISNLTKLNSDVTFFSWVDNSIIHLKKDSFEILIGMQNEYQNLGDLLDEKTIRLSKDSLLPQALIKNNHEIQYFQSDVDWKSLLPNIEGDLKYYLELNNFNVLGNSEDAMNWFITELQLGNVFSKVSDNYSHPTKVNQLLINQKEGVHQVTSKNWINKSECFVSDVKNLNMAVNQTGGLPLNSSFLTDFNNFKINTFIINDTLEILLFNDEKIMSYNEKGDINWTKDLKSPLISFPKEVRYDSISYVVLFMKNSIDIIDKDNVSLNGFPMSLNSVAKNGSVIQNSANFRLLVEVENQIININESGQLTVGWEHQALTSELKSSIEIKTSGNQSIINYIDGNDSLYLKNKFGKSVVTTSKLSLANASNYITGTVVNNDLRIFGFSNPYVISQLVNTGQLDSLKITQNLNVTGTHWTRHNDKIVLVVEEFNRVLLFNEFGLLEKEIQKPQPNLKLVSNTFFENDIIVFSDFKNKKLYLLDSYGRSLSDNPILGESNFAINKKNVVVYYNSNIYIYNLVTN